MTCKHCGKMIYQDEPYGWWVHGSPDRPRMMLCSDDSILHVAAPSQPTGEPGE